MSHCKDSQISTAFRIIRKLPNEIIKQIFLLLSPFQLEDIPEELNSCAEIVFRNACFTNRFNFIDGTFRESFFRNIEDFSYVKPRDPFLCNANYALQSFIKYADEDVIHLGIAVTVTVLQYSYNGEVLPLGLKSTSLEVIRATKSNHSAGEIHLVLGNSYLDQLYRSEEFGVQLCRENTITVKLKRLQSQYVSFFDDSTLYYLQLDECYSLWSVDLLGDGTPTLITSLNIKNTHTCFLLRVNMPYVCIIHADQYHAEFVYCYNVLSHHVADVPLDLEILPVSGAITSGLLCLSADPIVFSAGLRVHCVVDLSTFKCVEEYIIHSRESIFHVEPFNQKYNLLVVDEEQWLPFLTEFVSENFFLISLDGNKTLCYRQHQDEPILIVKQA